MIELAPDGVATVRLSYRSGDVINAAVSGNAYSFTPPQAPIKRAVKALRALTVGGAHLSERQRQARGLALFRRAGQLLSRLIPQTVQWLDAAGSTLRSFRPPSAGTAAVAGLFALLGSAEGSSSAAVGVAISTG